MNISEFKELKKSCEAQGLSAKKFCDSQGIAYSTWLYWSRKFRELNTAPVGANSFLQVLPEQSMNSYTATIESPSGWRVHVSISLAEVLSALPE